MKLFLYTEFEKYFNNSAEQLIDRLSKNAKTPGVFEKFSSEPFIGKVSANKFSIWQNIRYRNGALLVLDGNFVPCSNGGQTFCQNGTR